MANPPLTDLVIRKLKPQPGNQFEIFDGKVPWLSVRVSSEGTKSFCVGYRMGGKSRRMTLGRYPSMSLATARQTARQALSEVAAGRDPATEKMRARKHYSTLLFPVVCAEYIEDQKRKTRSWREVKRILDRDFCRWREVPVTQVTKQTIKAAVAEIVRNGGPSAANHAYSAVRALLNWCVSEGYLDHSPTLGMKAPCKRGSRDRVLNDAELGKILKAAKAWGYPFGNVVELLIFTAQRRDEVGSIRWPDIDLDLGLWTQPTGANKSGRTHIVPLSKQASEIIGSLPRLHDDLIFPARGKDKPISGFSRWKARLDERSGVKNWTLHDLRRTAATGMASLGVPPHIVELILNHRSGTLGGVAAIYNRFNYLEERRDALQRWAHHVEKIIAQTDKSQTDEEGHGPNTSKKVHV